MLGSRSQGAAYASQLAEGKLQSTLMYRPFKQWASNSDWTVHMPEGEEILGVAVGSSWVAATTSRHQLRLFTAGGIQSLVTTVSERASATPPFYPHPRDCWLPSFFGNPSSVWPGIWSRANPWDCLPLALEKLVEASALW